MCVLVEGLYQLEVTVFGYNNPTGRCEECTWEQNACCDSSATDCNGDNLCDSYFIYSVQRPLGGTDRDCSYSINQTSNINHNDAPLDFSQSPVLGLENPVILQGLTDTYMVMALQKIIILKFKFSFLSL